MMKKLLEFERIGRILNEIKNLIVKESQPVKNLLLLDENVLRPLDDVGWFGGKDRNYTVTGNLTVPEHFLEKSVILTVYSSLTESDNSTNPQIKLYLDDQLIQGYDVNHKEAFLRPDEIKKTAKLRMEIYSGREEKLFPLTVLIQSIDEATYNFYYDLFVLYDSWRSLSESDTAYIHYERELSRAVNQLVLTKPYSPEYFAGLKAASETLQNSFYQFPADPLQPTCYAVGHTHIDLAWLWTVMQAVQKGERSYSTVLRMMEDFPEYTFIQSQPQMYALIKEHYPDLYGKIKEKIVSGHWEPEGAMWVEADCNLTSGESLVRQFLYGKRFLKEEFNKESRILWLPDVFGYSAALPQIMKKTDTPYFMTTKLSWNQFNQIPHDSFYWQGIDGSRVLTHMMPTVSEGYSPTPHYTTYNGMLDPFTVKGSWERYQEKDVSNNYLIAYGYGDGGGGPTREMLETLKRMSNLPGIPKVRSASAEMFFDDLNLEMKNHPEKEWLGELYFEYHRGTYTSIGKIKKQNRQAETALQSIEKLFSIALPSSAYPKAKLEKWWKKVLLNQFHDILPGSAIEAVYQQTDQDYHEINTQNTKLLEEYFPTDPEGKWLYFFNPTGFTGDVITEIHLGNDEILLENQEHLLIQRTKKGKALVKVVGPSSFGGKYLRIEKTDTNIVDEADKIVPLQKKYESQEFLIKFDDNYRMVYVFDKLHQREITEFGGVVNELTAYEDNPLHYDAWNIDHFYTEKPMIIKDVQQASIIEQGPIRDTFMIQRRFYDSLITQYIHVIHGEQQIVFETEVDWHQQHTLLKAGFPVPVNSMEATYDVQFGTVKRPVHRNTSWDIARFEVAGQKWADLSDEGYGISLITDSKYGYDASYQHLGVSLIKSATDPYPEADQGVHRFSYAIYCHEGDWKQGETAQKAGYFNTPCFVFRQKEDNLPVNAWVACSEENIILDTVKFAEDEDGFILRAYEQHNRRTTARLVFQNNLASVKLCNLLENPESEVALINANTIEVTFLPYEIHTLKLKFA